MNTLCGLDCSACAMRPSCGGCRETGGKPFGGACLLALCCSQGSCAHSGHSFDQSCRLMQELIAEFNALGIPDMEPVTRLYALKGSFVNLTYTLPGGDTVRFWDDDRIYLGSQLPKKGTDRCYGLTADEHFLLVCEYGEGGSDPEIVVYKRRKA